MAMSAEQGQNVQPFTSYGDVSIWVKIFSIGTKTKQKTNKRTFCTTTNSIELTIKRVKSYKYICMYMYILQCTLYLRVISAF